MDCLIGILLDDNDKNLNLNLLFRMTVHPSWLRYTQNLIRLHQKYSGPQFSQYLFIIQVHFCNYNKGTILCLGASFSQRKHAKINKSMKFLRR